MSNIISFGEKRFIPQYNTDGTTIAGHTDGMVGNFLVQDAATKAAGAGSDLFSSAILNISRRMQAPESVLLERPILSPREWLQDPYYSGRFLREFWPQKKIDFILAAQGENTEVILTGAIGIGKSEILKALCAYDIYRLSCFVSPQTALGISPSETLVMVMVSLSTSKAKAKLFKPLKEKIDGIPYFREVFSYDHRLESVLEFRSKNIRVVPGVTSERAVHSEDVVWAGFSEVNFMPVVDSSALKRGLETHDVAQELVEATTRRMRSRFQASGNRLPLCRMVLDSSKQYPGDFLERRIHEIEQDTLPHKAVVISRTKWEARAGVIGTDGKPLYCGDNFLVEIGDEKRRSRILNDASEVPFCQGEVIEVPIEELAVFKKDLEGAIRDVAGRCVLSILPLIGNRERAIECIRSSEDYPEEACKHPFEAPSTSLQDGVKFIERYLVLPGGSPRVNPGALRTIHVDVGVTGDALGLTMCHVDRVVKINRGIGTFGTTGSCITCAGEGVTICARCDGAGYAKRRLGHQTVKVKCGLCRSRKVFKCKDCDGTGKLGVPVDRPVIYVDLMLQVVPPEGGEILLHDVEAFVKKLRRMGYRIPIVTADSYQSKDFLQRQLSHGGAKLAYELSVDKTKDPYFSLRDTLYDRDDEGKPIISLYDYKPLTNELFSVEDRGRKVDHPPNGSKDVSDSLAGAVYTCNTVQSLWYFRPRTLGVSFI